MITLNEKRLWIFLSLILILPSVCAIVGVRPASYEVNFEPGLKKVYSFTFIADEGSIFEMYTEGPFSEYVELSTEKIHGTGSVNALLQLPNQAEIPGRHRLIVGGRQVAKDEHAPMLGIVGNVQAVLFINVPYPGKYAELEFTTTNANTGGDVNFNLTISSKGDEDIVARSRIEIYDSTKQNLLETIQLPERTVKSTESVQLVSKLSTKDYLSGDYFAKAVVEYGGDKPAEKEAIFRLGKLFVDIVNYTQTVGREGINRFEIYVESYWNDPIPGLFAEVSIANYTELDFLTPSMTLEPWQVSILTGYFDTSEIKQSPFSARIKLKYANETTEKTVEVNFAKSESQTGYVLGAVAAVILIGIIVVLLLIKNKKKDNKKNEKRK